MIPYRVVEKKRNGGELDRWEMEGFFTGFLRGDVPDYQVSAFLMATYFQGLSPGELEILVEMMIQSGAVLDLSHLPGPRVDKHSTGGVGDKVSLVLAPLAAELGMFVPMMSGRGLVHSGGTIDKLEAIPGVRTDLSLERFGELVEELGVAMIGQTREIAPLDRRLYELRSVTATVPSLPLVAASIMSKKLAESLTALVLDVKVGAGAFIPEQSRALELARTMVAIGESAGVRTTALLTAMDRPLGRTVGSALETREALLCLAGGGPQDLRELVIVLAGEMACAGGVAGDARAGREQAVRALDSGGALERFARLVHAQGGDSRAVHDPSRLPAAPERGEVASCRSGTVQAVDPLALGYGVVELGGGRARLGDDLDPAVGFEVLVAPGDEVGGGDLIGLVHAHDGVSLERGRVILKEAIRVEDHGTCDARPLVSHRVTAQGVAEWVAGGT